MSTPVLIGNNLAVLVAAVELARSGREIVIATDGRSLGGHFSGVRIDDFLFDVGSVLVEKPPANSSAEDLRTYDPDRRYSFTQFGAEISKWLEGQGQLRRIDTPMVFVDGAFKPDYLIANKLNFVSGSQLEPPVGIDQSDPRHSARKVESGPYDSMTFDEAGLLNHGPTFQKSYIEPFVRKLIRSQYEFVLARYHRSLWAPLYYPETLTSVFRGEPISLPEYPFWTTENGCSAALICDLIASLAESPTATIFEESISSLNLGPRGWTVQFTNNREINSDRLALGLPAHRCNHLLGIASKTALPSAPVSLMFALVKEDDLRRESGCMMIADDDFFAYRITDHDSLAGVSARWHRITIEANPELIRQRVKSQKLEDVLRDETRLLLGIKNINQVQVLKAVTVEKAIVVPSADAVSAFSENRLALETAAPNVTLTGSLLGFGVSSMNDQILQGLKLYWEFS